jgi:hypothetical protein
VTALVPATSIHPQAPIGAPTWPFIKYGAPSGLPVRASCVDGNEITVALHGFAKPHKVGEQVVESAEDHAARIGSAIAAALDGKRLSIAGGHAKVTWTGSQLLQDGDEADAFHTVQNFRVRVLT